MANMDYPGPCFACSAIDGCSSDASREAAVKNYCKGLELEVNGWKARLFDVLADDTAQAKAGDTLDLLKSTIRELEASIAQLETECPTSLSDSEGAIAGKLESLRVNYTKALEVISPGWFGG